MYRFHIYEYVKCLPLSLISPDTVSTTIKVSHKKCIQIQYSLQYYKDQKGAIIKTARTDKRSYLVLCFSYFCTLSTNLHTVMLRTIIYNI